MAAASVSTAASATRACLLLLGAAVFLQGTHALDHTVIANECKQPILASTEYNFGASQFTNRLIQPHTNQMDEYNPTDQVIVKLRPDGNSGDFCQVVIMSDDSVVCIDGPTGIVCSKSKRGEITTPEEQLCILPP